MIVQYNSIALLAQIHHITEVIFGKQVDATRIYLYVNFEFITTPTERKRIAGVDAFTMCIYEIVGGVNNWFQNKFISLFLTHK